MKGEFIRFSANQAITEIILFEQIDETGHKKSAERVFVRATM
jgi:hypothetical protein